MDWERESGAALATKLQDSSDVSSLGGDGLHGPPARLPQALDPLHWHLAAPQCAIAQKDRPRPRLASSLAQRGGGQARWRWRRWVSSWACQWQRRQRRAADHCTQPAKGSEMQQVHVVTAVPHVD